MEREIVPENFYQSFFYSIDPYKPIPPILCDHSLQKDEVRYGLC